MIPRYKDISNSCRGSLAGAIKPLGLFFVAINQVRQIKPPPGGGGGGKTGAVACICIDIYDTYTFCNHRFAKKTIWCDISNLRYTSILDTS